MPGEGWAYGVRQASRDHPALQGLRATSCLFMTIMHLVKWALLDLQGCLATMELLVRREKKAREGLRGRQASSLMISAYLAPQLGEKRGTEGMLGQKAKRVSQEGEDSSGQVSQDRQGLQDILAFRGPKGTVLGDHLVPLGRKDLLGQDLRDARGHLVLRALLGLRAPSLSRVPIDKLSVFLGRRGHRGHQDLQAVLMCLLGCGSCRPIRA